MIVFNMEFCSIIHAFMVIYDLFKYVHSLVKCKIYLNRFVDRKKFLKVIK